MPGRRFTFSRRARSRRRIGAPRSVLRRSRGFSRFSGRKRTRSQVFRRRSRSLFSAAASGALSHAGFALSPSTLRRIRYKVKYGRGQSSSGSNIRTFQSGPDYRPRSAPFRPMSKAPETLTYMESVERMPYRQSTFRSRVLHASPSIFSKLVYQAMFSNRHRRFAVSALMRGARLGVWKLSLKLLSSIVRA